jgi:hypothetical protein
MSNRKHHQLSLSSTSYIGILPTILEIASKIFEYNFMPNTNLFICHFGSRAAPPAILAVFFMMYGYILP